MAEMLEFKMVVDGNVAVRSSDIVLIHSTTFKPKDSDTELPCVRVNYKYGNEIQWFLTFTPISEIVNRINEAEY